MAEILSLTQRQMCEKIAESMNWSNLKVSGLQAFLTSLIADEYENLTVQDLIDFGILEENRGFTTTSWTSDAIITGQFLESTALKFFARNPVYHNDNEWTTIMDSIDGSTICESLGTPIMDKVRYEGYQTIISYLHSIFNYNTNFQSAELCIQIGDEVFKICDITIDGNLITINKTDYDLTYAFQQLGIVVAGTKMIVDLCQGLSDGLHSPADLMAILNHYTKSSSSAISTFAQNILRKGRESIRNAIFEIVSLFRATFGDYQEHTDGTITWNINSTPVSTNFWLVAGNILIGGGQMVGTMLLFAGSIVLKVVGGVLLVGASILQAISTFTGTISGTAPLICDDAIDACYHDPIAQADGQDIEDFIFQSDLRDELELYGRVKIVLPSFVLYLYNYNSEAHTLSWKLFANMTATCPAIGLTYSHTGAVIPGSPSNAQTAEGGNYRWNTGYFSWATHFSGAYETDWSFSINDNNGKYLYYDSDASKMKEGNNITNESFNDFVTRSLRLAAAKQGISLTANSADAGAWKTLWHVLKENIIQTLCYVFCNPEFYSNDGDNTISSANPGAYTALNDIIKYDIYDGAPGYASIVNSVILLGQIDHTSDKFLYALLMTAGLLLNDHITLDINNNYVGTGNGLLSHLYDVKVELQVDSTLEIMPYQYNYVGIFPFMSIDPYAYVTPPTSDFKSIIFGAVVAALIVAATVAAFKVIQSKVQKKLGFKMQTWGKKLLDEGETFRNGFSPEEISQLSPVDRRTYFNAYNKYKLKVKLYNIAAGVLGMSSLDWINNWWNPYEAGPTKIDTPVATEINPDSVEAVADVVDSVGSLYKYTQDPEYFDENPTDAILLYRLISGRNPSQN